MRNQPSPFSLPAKILTKELKMRIFFLILAAILAIFGVFFPLLWVGATICLILAVSFAPSGLRADGKKKTGGLLGGLWDSVAVKNSQMREKAKKT